MLSQQKGTSLIEILVTILIVSFGLLGVAGVVGNGLKGTHGSQGRSQASLLAADIIDRMRANRGEAESAAKPYNLTLSADTPTGTTVAIQDLIAWRTALATALPSGTGAVSVDNATNKLTVTVQWDDSRVAGGNTAQTFVVETRL